MARIREERPGVGQHPHKTTQQTEHGEGVHLTFHPILLVVEPPSRTELYLARHASVLKITNHRSHHLIGCRIQVVEDGLGKYATAVQSVEETRHGEGGAELADGIKTRIWSQETHHPTVGIAYRPIMELLCPSLFGIHPGELHQHGRLETGAFRFVQMLTAIYLIIYLSDVVLSIIFCIKFRKPVV